jgi:hypothetical protein
LQLKKTPSVVFFLYRTLFSCYICADYFQNASRNRTFSGLPDAREKIANEAENTGNIGV